MRKNKEPEPVRTQRVNWWTMEEKEPPLNEIVPVSYSGQLPARSYFHALGTAEYWPEEGCWIIDGFSMTESEQLIVHAWCDLEPY